MKINTLTKSITVSAFGLVALLATGTSADAQVFNRGNQTTKTTRQQTQKSTPQPTPVVRQQQAPNRTNQNDQKNTGPRQNQPPVNNDRNGTDQRDDRRWDNNDRNDRNGNDQRDDRRWDNNDRNDRNDRYRVMRNGRYYETNSRGAALLQNAVNEGYRQGFLAGQADRSGRRRNNYNNSSMYRSGNYGYQSYVDSRQYQFYFQQGFEKGYQDGYYSRSRYGAYTAGERNILGSVLRSILNIERY